jgi:drug/metabolite transporter (DMT)-like permease
VGGNRPDVKRESYLPYLWMICGSVSFALMSTQTHALRDSCDWRVIASARAGLALVFAIVLAVGMGVRLVVLRPRILWIRSLAGSLSLICNFYAITRLPVAAVLTLTNMFPIWVALLSWPLERKRPSILVWLSVACGVLGVFLIRPPEFHGEPLAVMVAIAASFFTAIAMMGLHRLHDVDPWAVVVHFSGVSLIFCLGSLFVSGRDLPLPTFDDSKTLAMLLGIGITATVGQLFLTKAFAAGPPAKVAVIGLTQVVFAMLLEVALLNQSYDPTSMAGMALVMAPTAWLMVYRVDVA